jgi:phosphoglycerate dehydrogenase-like enzyme
MFDALVEHPLVLTNMRGLYSDVIAEHVLGMMLCFTRQLQRYIRNQAGARWDPAGGEDSRVTFATGPGVLNAMDAAHQCLGDLTAGIVGLGSIGREIARRLATFGMRLLAVDPQAERPEEIERLWQPEALDELLAASDFVIVTAPHTPETAGWFGRRQFQRMRESAIFINVGRGAIVRLDELVAALRAGEIAGAALDVFEIEPLPSEHPLWKLPNVILTPHVAGQAVRVPPRHLQVVVDNVRRFVRGELLANVVDKRRWF